MPRVSVVIPTHNRLAMLQQAVESVRAQTLAEWELIVVDDGIATGATVRAALSGLAGAGAAAVVLAVPVAPADTLAELEPLCNRIVCLEMPAYFNAVGAHYQLFDQVPDEAVAQMLAAS